MGKHKSLMLLIVLKIFFIAMPAFSQAPITPQTPLIAIIIDDIGYRLDEGLRATELPAAVTLSVIPFTPFGKRLAHTALERGKDIMLHAPMAPLGSEMPVEAGGFDDSMDQQQIALVLKTMLEDIEGVIGINNHMGSKLTQNRQFMNWFMVELKDHDLFFIDSLTSHNSQAWYVAQEQGLPSYRRDIFLDNQRDDGAIDTQFNRLVTRAKAQGYALAIGHPYPETLAYLEKVLPTLENLGVQLVSTRKLLRHVPQISKEEFSKTLASR